MRKGAKITLIIASVAVLAAGVVVSAFRWKAWFSNRPEFKYEVAAEPHNIVLSYGEKGQNSRIVSWRADTELQPSEVQLLRWMERDTLSFPAEGEVVRSRAGKAAFYRVRLDSLHPGNYSYRCCTADSCSEWYPIFIPDVSARNRMQEFLVFGDIQDKSGVISSAMFDGVFDQIEERSPNTQLSGLVFVGDIIERPMDKYWQMFFSAIKDKSAEIPVIASTGNHEYLKGAKKVLDPRWTHVFGNPQNGPERFLEKTYYIDFPNSRFIVFDTDALQLISDFTVMQTWLRRVLSERKQAWKVVVMHHPVYAAGDGRDNLLIRFAFRRILKQADVVFCGHDHNYMRLTENGGKPVYILTNSSEKFYEPKAEIEADCYASNLRFYEDMKVYADSLRIDTWNVETDSIFDSVVLRK